MIPCRSASHGGRKDSSAIRPGRTCSFQQIQDTLLFQERHAEPLRRHTRPKLIIETGWSAVMSAAKCSRRTR
jgi:hypothetical protein